MQVADGLIETLDEWLSRAEGHKTLLKPVSCAGPNQWLWWQLWSCPFTSLAQNSRNIAIHASY